MTLVNSVVGMLAIMRVLIEEKLLRAMKVAHSTTPTSRPCLWHLLGCHNPTSIRSLSWTRLRLRITCHSKNLQGNKSSSIEYLER